MIKFLKKTPKFKYLFVAEFTDGKLFKQTQEDKSLIDPKRNCYFDVLEQVRAGKTIRRFSLVGEGNTITVDLGNGIFYVNGLPVLLESQKLPILPEKFDLIWYHQVTKDMNVNYLADKDGKMNINRMEESGDEYREYFIGWQANVRGKNYQQKIGVS